MRKPLVYKPPSLKNPKAKGCEGEREFARYLTAKGLPARRGLQWPRLFHQEPDVVAESLPHVHIEVKRLERLNIHEALAQAARDAGRKVAVVAFRRNRSAWYVALRAEDWIALMRKEPTDGR